MIFIIFMWAILKLNIPLQLIKIKMEVVNQKLKLIS